MKRSLSAIIFISICFSTYAQSRQLDSLAYILPQFAQGSVLYSGGSLNHGLVNISPLNQTVYCITADNDTLTVSNNSDIEKVIVGNRVFVKWNKSFVETVISDESSLTGVGITRSSAKINNFKTGAYGMADNSSSIKSYSYDNTSHKFSVNVIDDPHNFTYRTEPCLVKDGKYIQVNKKNFQKLFPSQKDFIEAVWNGRRINVSDTGEVIDFYEELLQRQQ